MSWIEARKQLYTEEEIVESDLRVAIMSKLIKVRKQKGITQKALEELSGVKQPVIARMEIDKSDPQLDIILKLLLPLDKILAVVPLDSKS